MLTAAHCVTGQKCDNLKVVLGDHDVTYQEKNEVHRQVCGMHVHHRYQSVFQDVALLELCEPVDFSASIQPIKYATKG